MSVSSIISSASAILSPSYGTGTTKNKAVQTDDPAALSQAASTQASNGQASNAQTSDDQTSTDQTSGSQNPIKVSTQITGVTSQPNANGTLTVLTKFADGTSKTSIQPNLKPVTVASLLHSGNPGQLAALLAAQEESQQPGTGSTTRQ